MDERLIPPGDTAYLEQAWEVKEIIRRVDGAFKQPRKYFNREYRRETVHLLLTQADSPEVVAFAIIHANGYLSLFGVVPEHRRQGLGKRLLERLLEDHSTLTCHTRANNQAAIEFYDDAGFVVDRRIEEYYQDGTDALALRLERAWQD